MSNLSKVAAQWLEAVRTCNRPVTKHRTYRYTTCPTCCRAVTSCRPMSLPASQVAGEQVSQFVTEDERHVWSSESSEQFLFWEQNLSYRMKTPLTFHSTSVLQMSCRRTTT